MRKETTITKKFTSVIIAFIIIEVLFLSAFFIFGSKGQRLNDESYNILTKKAEKQQYLFTNFMDMLWQNSKSHVYNVKTAMEENFGSLENVKDASVEDQNTFINNIYDDIYSIVRKTHSTGAFIILENGSKTTETQKTGLYIHTSSTKVEEVIASVGNVDTINSIGLVRSDVWSEGFNIQTVELKSYYNNIIDNFKYSDKYTYFLPILDEKDNPVAVIGVEISDEYLDLFNSIDSVRDNVYLFGTMNENEFKPLMFSNRKLYDKILLNDNISFTQSVYNNLYTFESNDDYVGVIKDVNLNNGQLSNQRWVIVGLVTLKSLMNTIHYIDQIIVINVAISLAFGILVLFISFVYLVKPIKNLTTQVQSISSSQIPILRKTNIVEVNNIIDTIEKLNMGMVQYSQLTNAIGLFSLGIFFYQEGSNIVYCTQPFYDICGINKKEGFVEREEFEEIYKHISNNNLDNIFSACLLGNNKWVKIVTKKENNFTLGIITDVTKQIIEVQKIEKERDVDSLTKLYNRSAFNKAADKIFNDPDINVIAIIMWDIDKLKFINDTYGHDVGDAYICRFAEVIKSLEHYGGIVSRRSGDEFLGLLYGDNHSDVINIINELRTRINEAYILIGDFEEKLSVSTGIAWYPDDGDNISTLINYADFALYEVKYNIRGITNYFNKENYPEYQHLQHYNEEFKRIIDGDFITFAYQPIVDAQTGQIHGYEFLMRIFSELINTPQKLISLAKLQSKLPLIEEITFTKGFEAYESNLNSFGNGKIFLNSFSNLILCEKAFKKILKSNKLDNLVVEYTEFENAEEELILNKTDIIKSINAKVALDDYILDYDSDLIDKIDLDYIKIDMSIIDNIEFNESNQKVYKKIYQYAKKRDIKLIAEGVKKYEEMKYLIENGIDYLQGFYIGMPSAKPSKLPDSLVKNIRDIANNKINK